MGVPGRRGPQGCPYTPRRVQTCRRVQTAAGSRAAEPAACPRGRTGHTSGTQEARGRQAPRESLKVQGGHPDQGPPAGPVNPEGHPRPRRRPTRAPPVVPGGSRRGGKVLTAGGTSRPVLGSATILQGHLVLDVHTGLEEAGGACHTACGQGCGGAGFHRHPPELRAWTAGPTGSP